MYFIITIDTEGDNQWLETCRKNVTTENAKYLRRFQALCEEYGYKPTYLTSYEMALDKAFVEMGKECIRKRTAEIGSHPHAWHSPPDYDLTADDRKHVPYLIEYPEEILYKKVEFLTDLLESTFETKAVSHRAGRWGLNGYYAKVLEALGYRVDCSVTPFVSWESHLGAPDGNGGPDFRGFPTEAYFLDTTDISQSGNSSILELPMTIRRSYGSVLSSVYSIMPFATTKRAMRGVFGPPVSWFRCSKRNIGNILKMLRNELASNAQYVQFMLHSSELMPGCSPAFPTQHSIENLYRYLYEIFASLSEAGVGGATCSEFYDIFVSKSLDCQGLGG